MPRLISFPFCPTTCNTQKAQLITIDRQLCQSVATTNSNYNNNTQLVLSVVSAQLVKPKEQKSEQRKSNKQEAKKEPGKGGDIMHYN